MGDQLSVCISERGEDQLQQSASRTKKSRKLSTNKYSDGRTKPQELMSYSQATFPRDTVATRHNGTTTRSYIPAEICETQAHNTKRIKKRVEESRTKYALNVGKAHTEEEGAAIDIFVERAKKIFCNELEGAREEAAAKCMFALAQTIADEIGRVRAGSPVKNNRRTLSPHHLAQEDELPVPGVIENNNHEQSQQRWQEKRQEHSVGFEPTFISSLDEENRGHLHGGVGQQQQQLELELEPEFDSNPEEKRRKELFVAEMEQKINEKKTAKSMLGALLASNAIDTTKVLKTLSSTRESPTVPLRTGGGGGTTQTTTIVSQSLNNLLQRVALKNEKEEI